MNAGDSSAFVLPDFVRMRDFAIRDVRATQYRFRARRLAPIRSTPAVALVLPVRAEICGGTQGVHLLVDAVEHVGLGVNPVN